MQIYTIKCFTNKLQMKINIISHIKHILKFTGIFLILIIPIFYKEIYLFEIQLNRFLSSVLYILPICLLTYAIRNKHLYCLSIIVLSITSFIETILVIMFGSYINTGNILAIITTTHEEGTDFITNSIYAIPYTIPIIIGVIVSLYCYKASISNKKLLFQLSSTSLIIIIFLVFQIHIKYEGKLTYRFYIEQNILCRPPYNFFFQSYNSILQQHLRSYIKDSEKMSFSASKVKIKEKETYVLAIGESLRYGNLSIAGYNRNTTPLLDTTQNVILYNNYYSTANLTMYSVPQIITRATPLNFELSYKEKSIFKPFKECGFKTYAICCNNLLSYERHLTAGVDSLFCVEKDIDIAPLIDSLTSVHNKTFFIIQFFGNHNLYKNFRKEDNIFRPNPIYDDTPWSNYNAMVNAYDNTVRHTDYNIHNIIKVIDKPDTHASFIMISDHGEDFRSGTGGHGGNCSPNKEEYHVPFIVWCSEKWIKNNQEKFASIIKNKDMPTNSDNIFYSVCDIANIRLSDKYDKIEWSVASKHFKQHERYLLVPDGKNRILLK